MPSPCSTHIGADPLSLGLAPAANASGSAEEGALVSTPAGTFDNVLSQLGSEEPESTQTGLEAESSATHCQTPAPLSPEQIALLSQLLPQAAAQPAAPRQEGVSIDGASSLEPVGAHNRSVPELLASGVETLEYNVAGGRPAGASQAISAAARSGPTDATGPAAAEFASMVPPEPPAAKAAVSESHQQPAGSSVPAPADALLSSSDAGVTAAPSPAAGVPAPASDKPALRPEPSTSSEVPVPTDAAGRVVSSAGPAGSAEATAGVAAAQDGQIQAAPKPSHLTNRRHAGEKIAAASASKVPSGEVTPGVAGKKAPLTAEHQQVAMSDSAVGTTAAKWGKTMFHDARSLAASALQPDTPALAGSTSIGNGHTTSASTHTLAAAEPSSHAAELVHEIRDIADGLWAVDRNSVEVKFNFGNSDKLSVRVEYREGTVLATFRTDSPELRDAIAREWQAQSASLEQRPYRVADPVFSSSNFSMGGDASRQQRSAEQAQTFERAAQFGGSRNSTSTTTSAPALGPVLRPETAGHLHAIA